MKLTPYEHGILERLKDGARFLVPFKRVKTGYVFLQQHIDDPVCLWELIPIATLDHLPIDETMHARHWNVALQDDVAIYRIKECS